MKKKIHLLRNRTMHTKLTVAFSVPIILMMVVATVLMWNFSEKSNRSSIIKTSEKSFDQARALLDNYISTMLFAANDISNNISIQESLSNIDETPGNGIASQFREYIKLTEILSRPEISSSIYQVKFFINDERLYTNDQNHFATYSDFKNLKSYDVITSAFDKGTTNFFTNQVINLVGNSGTVDVVSLFRQIYSKEEPDRLLCVMQISLKTSEIDSLILNSKITNSGVVCVTDLYGNTVSVSGEAEYSHLKSIGFKPEDISKEDGMTSKIIGGRHYYCRNKTILQNGWLLTALIPESEILSQSKEITVIFVLITAAAVFIIFFVSYFVSGWYIKMLSRLSHNIHKVKDGILDVDFHYNNQDEISDIYNSFSEMTEELKKYIKKQYESGIAVKSAELRALQAQINPHFLYNTLDLINWTAFDYDAPEISELAQSLALFYKISLNKGKQVISIEEEIAHVCAYVKIENYHFDNAIHLHTEVPDELKQAACLNIILQPIVENSIMHGIAKNTAVESCNINISVEKVAEDLVLTVQDDGTGMTEAQIRAVLTEDDPNSYHGYGVRNINTRLKLSFGNRYGLEYFSKPGEGTTVKITIPVMTLDAAREIIGEVPGGKDISLIS